MKLCRFLTSNTPPRLGAASDDGGIFDLSAIGVSDLSAVLEGDRPLEFLRWATRGRQPDFPIDQVVLAAPVDRQEIWAAGVTYLRSKTARMEESDFSATAYDRVYAAARPELFFKSIAEKVVATGGQVGIRRDAKWNVPEPELALVINPRGRIVGYTIGNDMSSRDIEGENLLYLPQAKIYDRSCALGPWIALGASETEARGWKIGLAIRRGGATVFTGETSVAQIKRSFSELVEHLFRSQQFPHGVVLLTGTGVVPPETFTLAPDDEIDIDIDGIGRLINRVTLV